MSDLKPCPCGGEARLIVDYSYGRKGYSAQCQDCNRGTGPYYTKEDAVKAWNKTCDRINAEKIIETDQTNKADAGKARISLVPPQIVFDIAQVREYGNRKYGDSENWKTVEPERYIDALGRHYFEMIKDPHGKDKESGIEHYKHIACNLAFICELLKDGEADDGEDFRAQHEEYLNAYQQKYCSKCDVHIPPKIECSRCCEMARPINKKYNGDLCEVTYHCPSCGLDIVLPEICPRIAAWKWDDDCEREDVL